MDTQELIHKLEKARTKDDLEALGIEHLGIDVDKREAKEVLRAKLISEAESRMGDEGEPTVSELEPGTASTEAEPASEPESVEKPTQATSASAKMGRNKRTGRIMPWTPEMAKFSHMEQV